MLSEKLANLAAALRARMHDGTLNGQMMDAALDRLAVMAEDVRELELTAVADPAKLTEADLPENVIRLARVLHRQGVTVGPPPEPKNGGAA